MKISLAATALATTFLSATKVGDGLSNQDIKRCDYFEKPKVSCAYSDPRTIVCKIKGGADLKKTVTAYPSSTSTTVKASLSQPFYGVTMRASNDTITQLRENCLMIKPDEFQNNQGYSNSQSKFYTDETGLNLRDCDDAQYYLDYSHWCRHTDVRPGDIEIFTDRNSREPHIGFGGGAISSLPCKSQSNQLGSSFSNQCEARVNVEPGLSIRISHEDRILADSVYVGEAWDDQWLDDAYVEIPVGRKGYEIYPRDFSYHHCSDRQTQNNTQLSRLCGKSAASSQSTGVRTALATAALAAGVAALV